MNQNPFKSVSSVVKSDLSRRAARESFPSSRQAKAHLSAVALAKVDPYSNKTHRRIDMILFVLTIIILFVLLRSSAHAQNPSGSDPFWNPSTTGTGTWDLITANWNSLQNGTGTQSAWVNGSDAVFSATGKGGTAFTVTIANNTTISANSITVNNSGDETITATTGGGSTLSVGAGGITINSGAGAFTINGSKLSVTSATESWTNNSTSLFTVGPASGVDIGANLLTLTGTGNTTISGTISNTGGTGGLTKTGTGTLTLSGANSYSGGTTISGGTLQFAKTNSMPSTGNVTTSATLAVNAGGTGEWTNGTSGGGTIGGLIAGTGGQGTANQITWNSGSTFGIDTTNATGGTLTYGGVIGSFRGGPSTIRNDVSLTKLGSGTLTLTGASVYQGTTTINGGTLSLNNNGTTTPRLAGTSGITVNSGGTLLLSGTAISTDRINNSAGVTISGGGTFNTGGLSEGTRPSSAVATDGVAGMGALTLQSTSSGSHAVINFTSGTGSSLVFSSLSGASGAFVDVLNWTGTARMDSGATTNDRLLFATDPGITQVQLANWQFFNDSGTPFATGAMEIAYGNMFEIVPVPEPSTWVAGGLACLALALTHRRRLSRLLARSSASA